MEGNTARYSVRVVIIIIIIICRSTFHGTNHRRHTTILINFIQNRVLYVCYNHIVNNVIIGILSQNVIEIRRKNGSPRATRFPANCIISYIIIIYIIYIYIHIIGTYVHNKTARVSFGCPPHKYETMWCRFTFFWTATEYRWRWGVKACPGVFKTFN